MTTPDPPQPPESPDEGRDPLVAEWLAVDALDEVTRARLVRTALAGAREDESPRRSRRSRAPVLATAAALLVVLVVGLAVLVPRASEDTTPTAVDVPKSTRTAPASRDAGEAPAADGAPGSPAAAAEAQEALEAPLTLPSLGELGDVSSERRLERAARRRLATPAGSPSITVTGCAVSAGRAFGTPVAAGTGTIDGRPAVVVVSDQPAGTTGVVAVSGRSCARAVSVVLP